MDREHTNTDTAVQIQIGMIDSFKRRRKQLESTNSIRKENDCCLVIFRCVLIAILLFFTFLLVRYFYLTTFNEHRTLTLHNDCHFTDLTIKAKDTTKGIEHELSAYLVHGELRTRVTIRSSQNPESLERDLHFLSTEQIDCYTNSQMILTKTEFKRLFHDELEYNYSLYPVFIVLITICIAITTFALFKTCRTAQEELKDLNEEQNSYRLKMEDAPV